jgi:hypothetical protein
MKHLIFWLMMALAAPALAQDKPAAKEPVKEEQAKTQEEQPKKQAAASARKPGKRWHEDARHCLELPTNTEIIKCAEEYL